MRPWLCFLLPLAFLACTDSSPAPQTSSETILETRDRLKIDVKEPGIVRIPYEDLVATGFNDGVYQTQALHLSTQGHSVGLHVETLGQSRMGAGGYLEFYGQDLDTEFTDTGVYWLEHRSGALQPWASRSVTPAAGAALVDHFRNALRAEQNNRVYGLTPGFPTSDYWFWEKLTAPVSASHTFDIAALSTAGDAQTLRVCLLGATSGTPDPDHRVQVSLNGTLLGEVTWDGIAEKIQEFTLPVGLLIEGTNTFSLNLPGDTGAAADAILLNYVDVLYEAPLNASGNAIRFSATGDSASCFQVTGFTDSSLRVWDITDPQLPVQLTDAAISTKDGISTTTFQDPAGSTRTYWIATPSKIVQPASLLVRTPTSLKSPSSGADYILITPRAFLDAAQPLCAHRESQGLRVAAVAVEDIYDAFAEGLPTTQAIKDFLAYAYSHWTAPAPRYVLLLGDGTYDYRDRMKTGKASQVPAHLTWTSQIGLTPSDNWYADLEGDEQPELEIGRLPSATPEQASQVVQKLLTYETTAAPTESRALLVADNNDSTFQDACEALAPLLPSGMSTTKVYLSAYTNYSLAQSDVLKAFNDGLTLALYAGHGNMTDWAGEKVFSSASIPSLTNANHLPFVFPLNCLNGWFAMPTGYSLGESLVVDPSGGAIAVFASSGLGYVFEETTLARAFLNLLPKGGRPLLGDLCTNAKKQAYQSGASAELLRTYTLLGDPALALKGLP